MMNERIKELAEQCESFGSWDNKTYTFDKEKFAELIVRECMEWCDAHATIDGSAQQIRNSIKNYFGVEE
jgi:hypothetical protein